MSLKPKQFVGESIQPKFDIEPALEKKQGCPDGFVWRGEDYVVVEMVREWHDYARKGRAARNMQPQHAQMAMVKGSWGVGRDYFTIRTMDDRYFTLYYDRAPVDAIIRSSGWFLLEELSDGMDDHLTI